MSLERHLEQKAQQRNTAAAASDSLWAQARAAAEAADSDRTYPFDPDCRFAAAEPNHHCVDPFGMPVRPGATCFYEGNAQMHDQARRRRALDHYEEQASIAAVLKARGRL